MKRLLLFLALLCLPAQAQQSGIITGAHNVEPMPFLWDGICFAGPNVPGIDAGAKITTCINALPATGGTVDARGLEGAQMITADFFAGTMKPVTVLFGDTSLTVSAAILIPSNCSIIGAGMGRTIFQTAAGSAANFYLIRNATTVAPGNTNIWLQDFTVDGNKIAQVNVGQGGIRFNYVSNSTISHVEVRNSKGGPSGGIGWSATPGLTETTSTDNLIKFCYLHDNGEPANNADGLAIGGVRVRIVELISVNNSDSGIGIQGMGGGSDRIQIEGGIYINNTAVIGVASGCTPATNISIDHPFISGSGSFGISLCAVTKFSIISPIIDITPAGAASASAIHLENVQDGTVSSPTITRSQFHGIQIIASGVGTTKNVTVSGGVVRNSQRTGINIETVAATATLQNVTLTGMVVKNNSQAAANTYYGIAASAFAGSVVDSLILTGNDASDDQGGAATQSWGIGVNGAPTNVLATGNITLGNLTGGHGGPMRVITQLGIVFAGLAAIPANGTFIYCPDCTIANPCAAAGTGAIAKRLNGVWVCN